MQPRKALEIYLTRYRDRCRGTNDLKAAFQQVRDSCGDGRVLYPGSYLHITPSLIFSRVCYVDSLANFRRALTDPTLLDYINGHKSYPEETQLWCYQEDYQSFAAEPEASFDLLISLNAGFISQAAKRFLPTGGLLLVNDGHYDARRAFTDPDYQLAGVFEGDSLRLETSTEKLSDYFMTNKGTALTLEMVDSDAKRPPSKARFNPAKSEPAYLFRRL